MKTLLLIAAATLSLTASAGNLDKTEIVWVKGETAQAAYDAAMDIVEEVNADRWGKTRFSFLSQCNPTASDFDDDHKFNRKAYTSTSRVTLNHVTGIYGATVVVRCED